MGTKARRYNKYGAKKTHIDGICFDSKKEAKRYLELKDRLHAKDISDLKLQPRYDIIVNDTKIAYYKADFQYKDKDNQLIVEDVKGMKKGPAWAMFRLKKKLVEAIHNVEITVV